MSQNSITSSKVNNTVNFSHAQSEPDMQKALSDLPGITGASSSQKQSEPDLKKVLSESPCIANVSTRQKRPRVDTSPEVEHATYPMTEEFLQTIRREMRDLMSTEISKSIRSSIAEELGDLKEAMSLIRELESSFNL